MTDAGGTTGTLALQTVADVLIVGAGPAGLAAAATFLSAGFNVIVLEQSPTVGGWSCDVNGDKTCTGPVESLLFSDATFTASLPFEPTAQDVRMYLASYAQYHNVTDHVRLSCRVTHLAFDAGAGRWRAVFQDLSLGKRYQAAADFVVLCSGHGLPEGGALDPDLRQVPAGVEGVTVLHARQATPEAVCEAATAGVTVVGDGDAAVDCASAVALLRRGRGVGLVVRQPCHIATAGPSSTATSSPCYARLDGCSLLDSARRRALHAALQPHPSLPPPGTVGRALIAPTKRRFWTYLRGRAAAAVSRGSGSAGGSSRRRGEPSGGVGHAARGAPAAGADDGGVRGSTPWGPGAGAPRQPARLVLWSPSFRDPRVMSFLDPDLRTTLLRGGEPADPQCGRLVLYRGVVHPDVPGLAFVGWQSHASSRLLVSELQSQWLVALLTGRLKGHAPSTAAMRADMAAQASWRAAALMSPLMSTHGSLARTHEEHYVRQLLADLDGLVVLREQRWDTGPGHASLRPLLASRDTIIVPDWERSSRRGGAAGGGLGGCFGGGAGGESRRGADPMAVRGATRHWDDTPEAVVVQPFAPATPPASQTRSARPAWSFRCDSLGEQQQQQQGGGGSSGRGAKSLVGGGGFFARINARLSKRFSLHGSSPPVSPAASVAAAPAAAAVTVLAAAQRQAESPQPHQRTLASSLSLELQPPRSIPTTIGPPNRRTSASSLGSTSGVFGGGAPAGPRVTMLVPSPPIAPYLQNKLRRIVGSVDTGSRVYETPAGQVNDMVADANGGARRRRALSASHCYATTPTFAAPAPSAATAGEADGSRVTHDRRHRASTSALIFGARPRPSVSGRTSDAHGSGGGGGRGAAAAAASAVSSVELTAAAAAAPPASSRQGGFNVAARSRESRTAAAAAVDVRQADLSARLRRVSQSTGVDLSTLVDLMADGDAAGGSVLYIVPPQPPSPPPVGSGASGGGGGDGDSHQGQRRRLLARPSLDLHPLITAAGFLEGETMDEADCDAALLGGQHAEVGPEVVEVEGVTATAAGAVSQPAAAPQRARPTPEPLLRPRRAAPPPPPAHTPLPLPPVCRPLAGASCAVPLPALRPPLDNGSTIPTVAVALSPFAMAVGADDCAGDDGGGAAAGAAAPAGADESLSAQLAALRAHLLGDGAAAAAGASDDDVGNASPPMRLPGHYGDAFEGRPQAMNRDHSPQTRVPSPEPRPEPAASVAGAGEGDADGMAPVRYREHDYARCTPAGPAAAERGGWGPMMGWRGWRRRHRRTLSHGDVMRPHPPPAYAPTAEGAATPAPNVRALASEPVPQPPSSLMPPASPSSPSPPPRRSFCKAPADATPALRGGPVGLDESQAAPPLPPLPIVQTLRQRGPARAASLGTCELVGGFPPPPPQPALLRPTSCQLRAPPRMASIGGGDGIPRTDTRTATAVPARVAMAAADALSRFSRGLLAPNSHRLSAPVLTTGTGSGGGGSDGGSRPSTPASPAEGPLTSRLACSSVPRSTGGGGTGGGGGAAVAETADILPGTGSVPSTPMSPFRTSGGLARALLGLKTRPALLEPAASSASGGGGGGGSGGSPSGSDGRTSAAATDAAVSAPRRTWRWSAAGGADSGGAVAGGAGGARSRRTASGLRHAGAAALAAFGSNDDGGGVRCYGSSGARRTSLRRRISLANITGLMNLRGSDSGGGGGRTSSNGGGGGGGSGGGRGAGSLGGMLGEAAEAARLPYSKRLQSAALPSGPADAATALAPRQSAPVGVRLLDAPRISIVAVAAAVTADGRRGSASGLGMTSPAADYFSECSGDGCNDGADGTTPYGTAATGPAADPAAPITPDWLTDGAGEAESIPPPLPSELTPLVSGVFLGGATSSDDGGDGSVGRRRSDDNGGGESYLDADLMITLRRSLHTVQPAASMGNASGGGAARDGGDDDDDHHHAAFFDLTARSGFGGADSTGKPDPEISPAGPHTSPLPPPPPFYRQSWSAAMPLQAPSPLPSHSGARVPSGVNAVTAAAAAAATVAQRPLTTLSQPPPTADNGRAMDSLSAPLSLTPQSAALTAAAPAAMAAAATAARGRFAMPPWAPQGRQAGGVGTEHLKRSAASSDMEHPAWLRAAGGVIVGSPPSSGASYSPRQGPGPSPGPFPRPGGSYGSCGYSHVDVNEALWEAARWARGRQPPPPSSLQLHLLPSPLRRVTGNGGSSGGSGIVPVPDVYGTSAPLPYSFQQFRSRRDTADGSGRQARRESRRQQQQEQQQEQEQRSSQGGASAASLQSLHHQYHHQNHQSMSDERSPFVAAGPERGATGTSGAAGTGWGSGRGNSASRLFMFGGGARSRGSAASGAQFLWGQAVEGSGAEGPGSGGSAGGAGGLRAALIGGGGRLGPLVKRLGPAAAVRRESQERQDRLVNEISARLRAALMRKAQAQADSAAAAAAVTAAAVAAADGEADEVALDPVVDGVSGAEAVAAAGAIPANSWGLW